MNNDPLPTKKDPGEGSFFVEALSDESDESDKSDVWAIV